MPQPIQCLSLKGENLANCQYVVHYLKHLLYYYYYQDNEYVTAIKSVGSVLTPYDSDNQFPVFGFGAKFRHNGEVSHCFPLNFNPQHPEVVGVQVQDFM